MILKDCLKDNCVMQHTQFKKEYILLMMCFPVDKVRLNISILMLFT